QMDLKKKFPHRRLLVDQLKEQYGELLGQAPQVATNVNILGNDSAYTVTTGHQLNIFTGPLYFIFKIVSAIRLAKDLKQTYPDHDFVPVYWMATEDHDFEEINHTRVFGKKIIWDIPKLSATGRMSTANIADTVKQYCNTFGISHNAEKLTKIVEEAYLKE